MVLGRADTSMIAIEDNNCRGKNQEGLKLGDGMKLWEKTKRGTNALGRGSAKPEVRCQRERVLVHRSTEDLWTKREIKCLYLCSRSLKASDFEATSASCL